MHKGLAYVHWKMARKMKAMHTARLKTIEAWIAILKFLRPLS